MADWSNGLILKFLELYESERLLWDSKDKNHKLKHKVHDAWKIISLNMDNIPVEELKGKRKSLMATFRPLLKKKKASITQKHIWGINTAARVAAAVAECKRANHQLSMLVAVLPKIK